MLATNVAHGQRPGMTGATWMSSTRARAPRNPPAKMAASSRQSKLGHGTSLYPFGGAGLAGLRQRRWLDPSRDAVQQFSGPVQLEGPPPTAVLGLGQQPTTALDGGGQASGQGGLVALQAGPELASGLAELLGGRSSQPPQQHLGLLGGLLTGPGDRAGPGRPGAQQPPADRGQLLGQQGHPGHAEADLGDPQVQLGG